MAKAKPTYEMDSWGIYTKWNREEKSLPQIKKFTHRIPAELGIEFGYILKIKKAKGKRIDFRIEHPPFPGDDGNPAPPFTGNMYIRNNNWDFFLGDTVWEPADDKIGPWRLITWLQGQKIADETFYLIDFQN